MELERRIEQLEQEVEILKHQIQETLLDIQEKMLNRTHPSLRTATHEQPEEREPEEETPLNERPTQLHRPKNTPAREPEQPRQQPRAAKANKVVSITEYTGAAPKNGAVPEFKDIDWEELDRMEAWVLRKLKAMGIAKTRKLIRLHMTKGRISKDMAAALMQFVALYDKQQQPSTGDAPAERKDEEPGEQNLILRLIAGVSNAGTSITKGRKHG